MFILNNMKSQIDYHSQDAIRKLPHYNNQIILLSIWMYQMLLKK